MWIKKKWPQPPKEPKTCQNVITLLAVTAVRRQMFTLLWQGENLLAGFCGLEIKKTLSRARQQSHIKQQNPTTSGRQIVSFMLKFLDAESFELK